MALQALVLYSAKTAGNSMDLMEVKLTSSGMKPPETRAVHLKVVELGPGGGGGGGTPIYGPYRYVPRNRVWCWAAGGDDTI